ncbi:MAG: protein kinase [Sandaracinus sp.]|nr:protein kinase [Sandaracinus sp.]
MNERYELGDCVYTDGSGSLHVAVDVRLGRRVHVKVLRGRRPASERVRLEREARLLGGSSHPHLPVLVDARFDTDPPFLVFNYVAASPLSELVARKRPSQRTALRWASELAAALRAAHAEGIVHGDLHPEVILVTDDDARLLVHGFGRAYALGSDEERTTVGGDMPFPCFAAPESLLSDELDVRADVFGVCAVLHFLLEGRAPFDPTPFASAARALEAYVTTDPPVLGDVRTSLSTLLAQGLSRDPAKRPTSMLALSEGFSHALGGRAPAESDEDELSPGTLVDGRYRVRSVLGAGGMGKVYLAADELLRRDVALKVFFSKDELPSLHEARQLARVEHPSVVRVHSLGAHEGAHFVVTELVRGDALEQHLSRGTRVPLPTVAHVLDQILAGLDAIHGVGLAHGDLKPGNVIVDADWNVKLVDFGLARELRSETRSMAMTPAYCPPERLRTGGVTVDAASDLYSFGVLAFELLAGRLPFLHESVPEMLQAHLKAVPPALGSLDPALAPYEALVGACLAKAPEERPASAERARAMLREAARRSSPAPACKRVLVIEDEPMVSDVLTAILSEMPEALEVEVAATGRAGVARVLESSFDLVLLDMRLPDCDGLTVLKELRASHPNPPPVLVVSGSATSEQWRMAASLGARGLVFKPFDKQLLELTVRKYLGDA